MIKRSYVIITALTLAMPIQSFAMSSLIPRTAGKSDFMGSTEATTESVVQYENGETDDIPQIDQESGELETDTELDFGTELNTELNTEEETSLILPEPKQMSLDEFLTTMNSESQTYQNVDFGSVFEMMKNSLNKGESISLSSVLSIKGLTVPDNMMFDLSECGITGEIDPSLINLKYAEMVTGMDEEAEKVDLSSQSQGAVNLFKSEYGDIAKSLKVKDYELPKDFSVDKMTKTQNNAINKAYNDAYNTDDYKNIRKQISVSDIFEQANKGVTQETLDKNITATSNQNNQKNKSNYEKKKAESQKSVNDSIYGKDGYVTKQNKKKENAKNNLPSGGFKDGSKSMFELYDWDDK